MSSDDLFTNLFADATRAAERAGFQEPLPMLRSTKTTTTTTTTTTTDEVPWYAVPDFYNESSVITAKLTEVSAKPTEWAALLAYNNRDSPSHTHISGTVLENLAKGNFADVLQSLVNTGIVKRTALPRSLLDMSIFFHANDVAKWLMTLQIETFLPTLLVRGGNCASTCATPDYTDSLLGAVTARNLSLAIDVLLSFSVEQLTDNFRYGGYENRSVALDAVIHGLLPLVRCMADRGVQFDRLVDADGVAAVTYAVKSRSLPMLKWLLSTYQLDINALQGDKQGKALLCETAIITANATAFVTLLSLRADLLARTAQGKTILQLIVELRTTSAKQFYTFITAVAIIRPESLDLTLSQIYNSRLKAHVTLQTYMSTLGITQFRLKVAAAKMSRLVKAAREGQPVDDLAPALE